MPYETELAVALDTALAAGRLILDHYAALTPMADAPASVSTATDKAAQDLILARLADAFPADGQCAEEGCVSPAAANRERYWIVDPIDGTRGFVFKNGEFSVMIAFVEAGRVAAGVVYEPARERLTYATRGGGCFVRAGGHGPRPCRVSAVADLGRAVMTQSHSKPGKPSKPALALKPPRVVETYSAGVKLAIVARGEAEYYVNSYPAFNDWDVAAGHILVEEAGGRVSVYDGSPVTYGREPAPRVGGLIASNGLVHDAVVAGLAGG